MRTFQEDIVATVSVMSTTSFAQQVKVEEFTLPNGMKFLLCPRTDTPNTVSTGWIAKVGSVNGRRFRSERMHGSRNNPPRRACEV